MLAGKERLVVGDWTESLRLLNLAISVDPFQAVVFVMRGLLFQRINHTAGAKKDFRRVLEISPDYPGIRTRIAEVFLAEGALRQRSPSCSRKLVPSA
jgi:hypothetical protein